MRKLSLLVVLLCLITPTASATFICGTCQGHYVLHDSHYPYSEDIAPDPSTTMTNTWKTMIAGCVTATAPGGSSVALNGVNYHSPIATHALVRGYLALASATPGVRYEVRFVRKAIGSETIVATYGWFVRQVKDSGFQQGSSSTPRSRIFQLDTTASRCRRA